MKNIIIFILLITTIFLSYSNYKLKHIPPKIKIIKETIYKNLPSKYIGEYTITYYTHTGNKTSSGKYPTSNHTIAVDKNKIPMGSILYIEGIGYKVAEDTGSAIKGNKIDIFVENKEIAIKNGVQKRKVYLLK